MRTEVQWTIKMEETIAHHKIDIDLFEPSKLRGGREGYISIEFPESPSLVEFSTKVEDALFPNGYGYHHENSTYRLEFTSIEEYCNKPLTDPQFHIEVEFNQRSKLKRETMGLSFIELTITTRLETNSISLKYELPKIKCWKKILLQLLILTSKREYLYEIDRAPGKIEPEKIDRQKGFVFFELDSDVPGAPLGFAYKPYKVNIMALFTFIIGAAAQNIIDAIPKILSYIEAYVKKVLGMS